MRAPPFVGGLRSTCHSEAGALDGAIAERVIQAMTRHNLGRSAPNDRDGLWVCLKIVCKPTLPFTERVKSHVYFVFVADDYELK